ncbi:MAG: hypothetical protein ACTSQP_05535 [Promethearchaeota archaeon]
MESFISPIKRKRGCPIYSKKRNLEKKFKPKLKKGDHKGLYMVFSKGKISNAINDTYRDKLRINKRVYGTVASG